MLARINTAVGVDQLQPLEEEEQRQRRGHRREHARATGSRTTGPRRRSSSGPGCRPPACRCSSATTVVPVATIRLSFRLFNPSRPSGGGIIAPTIVVEVDLGREKNGRAGKELVLRLERGDEHPEDAGTGRRSAPSKARGRSASAARLNPVWCCIQLASPRWRFR